MPLMFRSFIFLLVVISLTACSSSRKSAFKSTNKIYFKKADSVASVIVAQPVVEPVKAESLKVPEDWAGTTNFGLRKPNMVIIHHTAQDSCGQTLRTFTLERTQVSAHYVICKDGTLNHMLNDYLRGWHAGNSQWGSNTDINSSSIGIEIDNNGFADFTGAQLNTLLGLLKHLKEAYRIPAENFIGHGDIAPGRKVDPQVKFPWKILADSGYGIWYDTTGIQVPQAFDERVALRLIGYDIRNLTASVEAFRRHFMGYETKGMLTNDERKVLQALVKKVAAL